MMCAGASLMDGTLVQYCVDIDDRKHAEMALRASEEKYRALFNEMDEAYAVVEGRVG
jgi:PAS domain-containing protein